LAVCHPNLVHIRKKTSSKLFLIGLWTISVVCMLPVIIYSSIVTVTVERQESSQMDDPSNSIVLKQPIVDELLNSFAYSNESLFLGVDYSLKAETKNLTSIQQYKVCNILWPESNLIRMELAFIAYSVFVSFLIPIVMIICFYVKIVFHLHLKSSLLNKHLSLKLKERRKVTFLVLLVIGICIIAYTPYWIFQIILLSYYLINQANTNNMAPSPSANELGIYKLSTQLSTIFQLFVYMNSALNPFIYGFISQVFRASFMEAFKCKYSLKYIFSDNNYHRTRTRTKTSKRSSN
jgi:hypothetical protein